MIRRRIPAHMIRFSARRRGSRRSSPMRAFIGGCTVVMACAAFLGFVAGVGFIAYVAKSLPEPDQAFAPQGVHQSTKVYDRTGRVKLYELFQEEKRTVVALESIPAHLRAATIAAEDKDFYRHSGFDVRGILRAFYVNLTQGALLQGGSTITQQLIKNTLLSGERTWMRKVKELILSYRIEQKFTKDQILKLYLNEIPYGSNAYGIEAASEVYFGIPVQDLTIAQAALLAALPKAPSRLSPFGGNREELMARQKYIIGVMQSEGAITPEEASVARNEIVTFTPKQESLIAPHFIMYVRELLGHDYTEAELTRNGLRVTTTLDLTLQKYAEEAVAEFSAKNEKDFGATNAALVALDAHTGEVVAMVGSRDFFRADIDGQVNVALRPRQPGSSFKPMVYAAAFAKGYTPETVLYDVETTFPVKPQPYTPHNYNGKESGPVSLARALAGSLNIPAVKLLYLTGVDTVLDMAYRMGYTTLSTRSRFGLSLVLGGAEVKLLEHANAFRVLVRDGMFSPTLAIQQIEDVGQGIPRTQTTNPETRVLSAEVAREVDAVLSNAALRSFVFGSPSYLELPDRQAVVKTGTTNDFRDAWTLGATPSLVVGVWVGNNDNTPMKKGADGSKLAAPIWQAFMKKALAGKPVEVFPQPSNETSLKEVLRGEGIGEVTVAIDRASLKRATERTPVSFRIEKKFYVLHDILHFVDKDNPTGPVPTDPTKDPMYVAWESGVATWASKQNIGAELPPVEEDDVHVTSNTPTVTIFSPFEESTVFPSSANIEAQVAAPRGIVSRVEIVFDGALIGTLTQAPFVWPLTLTGVAEGRHTITVAGYDDVDNRGEASVSITVVK